MPVWELHCVLPLRKLGCGTSFATGSEGPMLSFTVASNSAWAARISRVSFSSFLCTGFAGNSSPSLSHELELELDDVELHLDSLTDTMSSSCFNSETLANKDSTRDVWPESAHLPCSSKASLALALDFADTEVLRLLGGGWCFNPNGKARFFFTGGFFGGDDSNTWETPLPGRHLQSSMEPIVGKVYSSTRIASVAKGPHSSRMAWKTWQLVNHFERLESGSNNVSCWSVLTLTSNKTWSFGFISEWPRMKCRRLRPNLISKREPVCKSPEQQIIKQLNDPSVFIKKVNDPSQFSEYNLYNLNITYNIKITLN